MSYKIKRRPFKLGTSWAITLPPGWCRYYGDRISTVTVVGHTLLIIAPKGLEEHALRIVKEGENAELHSNSTADRTAQD